MQLSPWSARQRRRTLLPSAELNVAVSEAITNSIEPPTTPGTSESAISFYLEPIDTLHRAHTDSTAAKDIHP